MGKLAPTTLGDKPIGPVGYGMLGKPLVLCFFSFLSLFHDHSVKETFGLFTDLQSEGLTIPWAPVDFPIAAKAMKTALEQGANMWNGVSEVLLEACNSFLVHTVSKRLLFGRDRLTFMQGIHYGTPEKNSLHLLKYYFEKYPEDADKVVLSIKGAYGMKTGPDGSPEGIRASAEEAYRVLSGIKTIDVFECARVDSNHSVESQVQTLADLVKEGKIGSVGLSEAGAKTIRKAHAIHPIAAVEIELSLFTPDPLQNGIVDACRERKFPFLVSVPRI